MSLKIDLDGIYAPSDDVVARDIEGELIIVPLVSGIGDLEDELFSFNETGREIWNRLNGKETLKNIIIELAAEYDCPFEEIGADVLGLVKELIKRKMLVEIS
ncbi:MAG: PqqD family protein [Candidatus Aminicenantes bacterium]|nr:PqqD family protein [Candidatus Aminicenantes bacterium]